MRRDGSGFCSQGILMHRAQNEIILESIVFMTQESCRKGLRHRMDRCKLDVYLFWLHVIMAQSVEGFTAEAFRKLLKGMASSTIGTTY